MEWLVRQAPALILVIPLTAAVLLPVVARALPRARHGFALSALALTLLASVNGVAQVLDQGSIPYAFGSWAPPIGIGWQLDALSSFMCCALSAGMLIVVFGLKHTIAGDAKDHETPYYTCLLLMFAGLLGILLSADLFNIFVFLEVSSLSAYALLGVGHPRGTVAAYRYLLVGTVGASLYLLGVGFLYAITGTLNMADMTVRLQPLWHSRIALGGLLLILTGLALKAAVFPLHGWLPNVYAYASNSAATLIAPFMTKVSAYALLRVLGWVFIPAWSADSEVMHILRAIALVGLVAAPLIARIQPNFRRLLAYSSIGQLGLILVGVSLASSDGLQGALLLLLNDMIAKSVFFLTACVIALHMDLQKVVTLSRLRETLPLYWTMFVIACLSMIGIPPTLGFFGKWYLIVAALEQGRPALAGIIVLSAVLSAAYVFVLIEQLFGKPAAEPERAQRVTIPWRLTVATGICSLGLIVLGLFNFGIVNNLLQFVIPLGGQ